MTATATPTIVPAASTEEKPDKKKPTEQQQLQAVHTNRAGQDDYHTEGNVVEVHLDASRPYAGIGTRDGLRTVLLPCAVAADCPWLQVGDYLEAEGTKENEALFDGEDVTVTRGSR